MPTFPRLSVVKENVHVTSDNLTLQCEFDVIESDEPLRYYVKWYEGDDVTITSDWVPVTADADIGVTFLHALEHSINFYRGVSVPGKERLSISHSSA